MYGWEPTFESLGKPTLKQISRGGIEKRWRSGYCYLLCVQWIAHIACLINTSMLR